MTNKEGMDALSGLVKAQTNPKYAGAASAKIVDALNKSGIIDSEYINTVDNIFNQQQQLQSAPVINWDVAPQ